MGYAKSGGDTGCFLSFRSNHKGLSKSLQNVGIMVRTGHVQKTALLGTARILRRILEI